MRTKPVKCQLFQSVLNPHYPKSTPHPKLCGFVLSECKIGSCLNNSTITDSMEADSFYQFYSSIRVFLWECAVMQGPTFNRTSLFIAFTSQWLFSTPLSTPLSTDLVDSSFARLPQNPPRVPRKGKIPQYTFHNFSRSRSLEHCRQSMFPLNEPGLTDTHKTYLSFAKEVINPPMPLG